jgi:hypothetical protein
MSKQQRQLSKLQEYQILSEYSTSSMHSSGGNPSEDITSQLKVKTDEDLLFLDQMIMNAKLTDWRYLELCD